MELDNVYQNRFEFFRLNDSFKMSYLATEKRTEIGCNVGENKFLRPI